MLEKLFEYVYMYYMFCYTYNQTIQNRYLCTNWYNQQCFINVNTVYL